MTEYTPTTEDIREYVAGGDYQPWEPPDPKQYALREAAFDRWLAAVVAAAKAEAFTEFAADAMTEHISWNGANEAVRNRALYLAERAVVGGENR
jgi:flavin-dependent dehydrogenase